MLTFLYNGSRKYNRFMLQQYIKLQEEYISLQEKYGKLLAEETKYLEEGMKSVALKNYLMSCSKNKEIPDLDILRLIENQDFQENSILSKQFSDIIQN